MKGVEMQWEEPKHYERKQKAKKWIKTQLVELKHDENLEFKHR
jgi:hypothetical protein